MLISLEFSLEIPTKVAESSISPKKGFYLLKKKKKKKTPTVNIV
jgi:hypothetical protein